MKSKARHETYKLTQRKALINIETWSILFCFFFNSCEGSIN